MKHLRVSLVWKLKNVKQLTPQCLYYSHCTNTPNKGWYHSVLRGLWQILFSVLLYWSLKKSMRKLHKNTSCSSLFGDPWDTCIDKFSQKGIFLNFGKISYEEMFNKIDNQATLSHQGNCCSLWHFGIPVFLNIIKYR